MRKKKIFPVPPRTSKKKKPPRRLYSYLLPIQQRDVCSNWFSQIVLCSTVPNWGDTPFDIIKHHVSSKLILSYRCEFPGRFANLDFMFESRTRINCSLDSRSGSFGLLETSFADVYKPMYSAVQTMFLQTEFCRCKKYLWLNNKSYYSVVTVTLRVRRIPENSRMWFRVNIKNTGKKRFQFFRIFRIFRHFFRIVFS